MDKALLKKKIEQVVSLQKNVIISYLFGSQAKGTAGLLSDIDIAVYFDEVAYDRDNDFEVEYELALELEKALDSKQVDLVVLNNAPVFLRYQVLKDGEIVYCSSEEERIKFHEETMRSYLDFLPFREIQNNYLQKRIDEGLFGR